MIATYASGTQTATVGTEHFLSSVSAKGEFQLVVDTTNMVDGDATELRIYRVPLTGGTPTAADFKGYYGAQPAHEIVKESPYVSNDLTDTQSLRFSLKQTFGTGRDFAWKVLKRT